MHVTKLVTFDTAERRRLLTAFNPWRIVVSEPHVARTLGESEAQEQFGNLFTRVLNENAQLPAHVIATARDALRILSTRQRNDMGVLNHRPSPYDSR